MSAQSDLGGGRHLPPAYDQAGVFDCPNCGAEAGKVCRFTGIDGKEHPKKCPCIRRILMRSAS